MTDPTRTLPPGWAARLAVLVTALGHVPMSYRERASLAVLAGQEPATVEHLAALIGRARRTAVRRALAWVGVAFLVLAALVCLAVLVVRLLGAVGALGPVLPVAAGTGVLAALGRVLPAGLLAPAGLIVAAVAAAVPWVLLGVLALLATTRTGEGRERR